LIEETKQNKVNNLFFSAKFLNLSINSSQSSKKTKQIKMDLGDFLNSFGTTASPAKNQQP